MLSFENGMTTHRRLLTIMLRLRRRKPSAHKILCMSAYGLYPHSLYIRSIPHTQAKATPEGGLHQLPETAKHMKNTQKETAGATLLPAIPEMDAVLLNNQLFTRPR